MSAMIKKLTSLELHLKYEPEVIVEAESLEDVGCGMYPCYYLIYKDGLKVSTSVTSLIFELGNLKSNPAFLPPDFMKASLLKSIYYSSLPDFMTVYFLKFKCLFKFLNIANDKQWYPSWETIDIRVKKLKSFERVTQYDSVNLFKPDFLIRDKELFINKSAYHLTNFANNVEKQFPTHMHIILTGGKDSQLISLVPKLHSDNWCIFSAEPNYSLVKRWVKENGIKVSDIFGYDNHNEEQLEDLRRKIICSDLNGDPHHIRWMPTLRKIAQRFNNRCIFWAGSMGDTIYSFHPAYHGKSGHNYFEAQITRAASWQGNYHQTCKNFVGVPLLSPYHSAEIWSELFQHFDPMIIQKGQDLRIELGEKLFGKPVKWINENPAPKPYHYWSYVNCLKEYKEYINSGVRDNDKKTP